MAGNTELSNIYKIWSKSAYLIIPPLGISIRTLSEYCRGNHQNSWLNAIISAGPIEMNIARQRNEVYQHTDKVF